MIVELPKLEDLSKDDVLEPDTDILTGDDLLADGPPGGMPASPPSPPPSTPEQPQAVCFFEPVFSVQKMGVIALETVRRVLDPEVPGRWLERRDLSRRLSGTDPASRLAWDRVFRQKSLECFFPLQARSPELLMFVEADASLREEASADPDLLRAEVGEWPLDPRRIVVQVSLAGEFDPVSARDFLDSQRDRGFLTALRDVSPARRHLEVLRRLNPDMVKVSDGLIRGLAGSREKQASLLGILRRAHSLGILIVAGGVESEEDALVALESGVDLVQGRYFSKNYGKCEVLTLSRKARMQFLASRFKRRLMGKANRDLGLKSRCTGLLDALAARLPDKPARELEGDFPSLFGAFPSLECLYLINAEGVQVSTTLCSQYHIPDRKGILFQPSIPGTDHSLREFYYALLASPLQRRYVAEPSLSMNSGNLCVTVALVVGDPAGDFHILCADLNAARV